MQTQKLIATQNSWTYSERLLNSLNKEHHALTQGTAVPIDHYRGGSRGGTLGAEAPPPFIFRLYLINMLSIIMKFCLSIII